jgi:hypothetical protein
MIADPSNPRRGSKPLLIYLISLLWEMRSNTIVILIVNERVMNGASVLIA